MHLTITLIVLAVAAAMGVPASVIFEGKFSSNSMSQCAAHSNPTPARID